MSRPWMPFYIADYRKDTAHLSTVQHGAYLLLIMHYWATGGLPNDDEQLSRIACLSVSKWKRIRPIIESFFDQGWQHKRINQELAKAADISNKRKIAADKKHQKRSEDAHANAPANAELLHTQSQSQSQRVHERGQSGLVSSDAISLSEDLAAICGHAAPKDWPPGWCGAPMWVQKCLNEGWVPEVMRAETRAVMARKRDGPVDGFKYLEKPLARAQAQHAAPLPRVVVNNEPEVIHARRAGTDPSRSIIGAADRLVERMQEFGQSPGICSSESAPDVRLLPNGRRERS
jgi:uncharacterized protein YdaU (DUF1376 family)